METTTPLDSNTYKIIDANCGNDKEANTEKSGRKRRTRSAEVAIKAEFDDGEIKEYIIVSDENDANDAENVFYLSDTGKELLSAAYAKQRRKKGSLSERKFMVLTVKYPLWKDTRIGELVIRNDLRISPNGGQIYKHSKRHPNDIVIESLLYSRGTNRFEVIRATRDRVGLPPFVDVSLYREFVHKYGRPALTPTFDDDKGFSNKSAIEMKLNPKSVLKCYGYSVNKIYSIEDEARQELLTEIVDLEILPIDAVVGFLDFLILSHDKGKDTDARAKWRRDRDFIQNYKPDPQRFLRARD